MSLADVNDYTLRYGAPADPDRCAAQLEAASSLVQHVTRGQLLEAVDGDEVHLIGDGSRYVFLPQIPVRDVVSITVAGAALTTGDFTWNDAGLVERRRGCFPCDADVVVVYDHGFAPMAPWLVDLVCAMVQRANRPNALSGAQSLTTGAQTIAYAVSAAGVSLWLTSAESAQVEALRSPVLA